MLTVSEMSSQKVISPSIWYVLIMDTVHLILYLLIIISDILIILRCHGLSLHKFVIITLLIQPACQGNCFNHVSKPVSLQSFICLSRSGVRQALWLTKTKLISSLPPQLLSLAESPANQIPDQDERVQNAIKHARFWDTTEERPGKEKYR